MSPSTPQTEQGKKPKTEAKNQDPQKAVQTPSEDDAKARAAKIAARKARAAALIAQANATSPRRITVVYGSILKKQKEVDSFTKGTVIQLDRQPIESAEILVDGKLFAKGKLSSQNGHASVQITEIVKK
ncbi:MAG: FliM/FliN family flagellar motor switch protein [Treponema sp.]|nr:FliM/FliN family flagellar motor switch protein [Treponema sp.]MBP5575956.1 FliM/FliN family flagellar motor switch protein [Treponema sp.]